MKKKALLLAAALQIIPATMQGIVNPQGHHNQGAPNNNPYMILETLTKVLFGLNCLHYAYNFKQIFTRPKSYTLEIENPALRESAQKTLMNNKNIRRDLSGYSSNYEYNKQIDALIRLTYAGGSSLNCAMSLLGIFFPSCMGVSLQFVWFASNIVFERMMENNQKSRQKDDMHNIKTALAEQMCKGNPDLTVSKIREGVRVKVT